MLKGVSMTATTNTLSVQTKGLHLALGQFYALWHTELLMQWRRSGLWIAFALITVLFILVNSINLKTQVDHYLALVEPARAVAFLAYTRLGTFVGLLCIVVGLLTIDRLKGDEMTGATDLQKSTSLSMTCYVWGKFLGNYCALVLPCCLSILLLLLSYIVAGVSAAISIPFSLSALLILLPACAFVIALTLLFAALVPLRIAQIGFPVLWLWAILAPLDWPSPAMTVLNPLESYASGYWFRDPQQPLGALEQSGHTLTNAWLNVMLVPLCACLLVILLTLILSIQTRYHAGSGRER
jgi:hypothetical protein